MHGEMAKYRIDDMVRDAETYRRSRATGAARQQARRSRTRRAGAMLAAIVAWPFRR